MEETLELHSLLRDDSYKILQFTCYLLLVEQVVEFSIFLTDIHKKT